MGHKDGLVPRAAALVVVAAGILASLIAPAPSAHAQDSSAGPRLSLNVGHDPDPDEGGGRFPEIRQAGRAATGTGLIGDSAGRRYATRATTPSITGLAITSDPGSDNRYVSRDKIEVLVTFSEAVTVTGSPRLTLLLGSPLWIQLGRAARHADFARQPEPRKLVFAYTVATDDSDPDGVSVAADSFSPNGGTIAGSDGAAARLTHDALAAQPRHLVDTVAPSVLNIFVDGRTLSIGYSEALDMSSVPAASRFRVHVDNAARSVSGVSVANKAVTLTLATAVLPGEEVDVSYSAPQTGPIRDLARHSAAGFALSALEVVNETRPTVSIAAADDAVYEGTDVEFRLTRNGPVIDSLIVDVDVVDGGNFLEFETSTQTLEVTFEAGNSTALLTLSTLSDLDYEAHAGATATVRPSSRYAVSTTDGSATVTISDNDVPETAVAMEVPASVAETSGTLTVRVRAATIRDEAPHSAVSIILASADGTAVAGEDGDFTAIETVVRFATGDFERVEVEGEQRHVHVATVEKKINIHDDAVAERDETFTLHLRQPGGVPRRIRLPDSPTEVSITDNEAPGRPANVAAEPGDGMVTVSWSEVASATGYKVQWKSGTTETFDTAPVDNRQQIVSGGTTTSTAIEDLTNGTAYTLQVIAFNSGGDGPASPQAMATPQMPPALVTGVTLSEGDATLTVAWGPATHATSYKVQWKSGTDESFETAAAKGREHVVSGTLYLLANLDNCTPYTVRIIATNHGVDGPASAEAIGTPTFEPERARPGTRLISNTGYDVVGALNLRLTVAGGYYTQEFTTGSNSGDFSLESVGVRIGRVFPGPAAVFNRLHIQSERRGRTAKPALPARRTGPFCMQQGEPVQGAGRRHPRGRSPTPSPVSRPPLRHDRHLGEHDVFGLGKRCDKRRMEHRRCREAQWLATCRQSSAHDRRQRPQHAQHRADGVGPGSDDCGGHGTCVCGDRVRLHGRGRGRRTGEREDHRASGRGQGDADGGRHSDRLGRPAGHDHQNRARRRHTGLRATGRRERDRLRDVQVQGGRWPRRERRTYHDR